MMLAANLAGRAFTRAYVGYVHAIAHALGGLYHTAHGLGIAVSMPYVLEEYGKKAAKRLAKISLSLNLATKETPREEAAKLFIEWLKQLNKDLNIPANLPEIKDEDIQQLAHHAIIESNPFYPVPQI